MTTVTVDKNLKPVRVTPLSINNEIEHRRFEEAKIRRETRMQLTKAHLA